MGLRQMPDCRLGSLHEIPSRRPVAMAIEQRPDDPAVEDSLKGLMMRLRDPVGDDFITANKTSQPQAPAIGRSTTKAFVARRECFLQAFLGHFREPIVVSEHRAGRGGKTPWARCGTPIIRPASDFVNCPQTLYNDGASGHDAATDSSYDNTDAMTATSTMSDDLQPRDKSIQGFAKP